MRQINIFRLISLLTLIIAVFSCQGLLYAYEHDDEKTVKLSESEKAWLKEHPVIRVSNEPDYAPFDFSYNGKPAGYSIDYVNLLAKRVGLKVVFVLDTWNNLLQRAKQKEIDLMQTIYKSSERSKYLIFTKSYKTVTNGIYVRSNVKGVHSVSDLSSLRVVVPRGDVVADLLPKLVPDASYSLNDTYVGVLKDIELGKADATILPSALANYLIRQYTLSSVKPVGEAVVRLEDEDYKYHLAVRKDWPLLHSILEKAMESLTPEELAALETRWLTLPGHSKHSKDASSTRLHLTDKEVLWLKAHPTIRVHNETGWAPFNFYEDGAPKGLSIDYMNLLAKKIGIRVSYVSGPSWNSFLNMIRNKELDVMLNIVKTEDRLKYILYTKPYALNPNVIVSRKENRYESIDELYGKTISFPKGFFYEEVLKKHYPQIKRLPVLDTFTSLKEVLFGNADAALGESAVFNHLINKHLLTELAISGEVDIGNPDLVNLRIGVRNDWETLQAIIEKAMESVTIEEMNKLRHKWIIATGELKKKSTTLTKDEKKWLKSHKNPRLGIDPLWPPFEFLNSTRVYSGIASDYIRLLNKELDINMQPVSGLTWTEVIKQAKEGKIDILPCLVKTPERSKFLLFTDPYLTYGMVILTRNDAPFVNKIQDFTPGKVAVVNGYFTQELLERDCPDFKFYIANNIGEAVLAVSEGKLDAFVGNLAAITYKTNELGLDNLKIAATMPYTYELAFGVRKDWPEMVSILNKKLATLSKQEKSRINSYWINVRVKREIDWRQVGMWIGGIFAFSASIVALVLDRSRRLTHEMAKRTVVEQELKDAKEVAEAATRAKSDFLATMSHEIRTPMNAIVGMTFLAMETQMTPKQRDYLQKIDIAAKSLLVIINDILDFSKIEAGMLNLEEIEFQLDEVLEKLSSIMAVKVQEKEIELLFNIAPDVPFSLIGDPVRLEQILVNLVNNAVKFTEKGEIEVSNKLVRHTSDNVCIMFSVRDTGIGMNEKQINDLFHPFTQADTSTTRRFGGTGLGLTISKRIVEMMGGEIWVESEPDKGSIFFFTAEFGMNIIEKKSIPISSVVVKDMRVLVVDDNDSSHEILKGMIESFNMSVTAARSGKEAIELLDEASNNHEPFQLVVTDWKMPEMNGIELASVIKERTSLSFIPPVIMVSAAGGEKIANEIESIGIKAFLNKPLTHSILYDAIVSSVNQATYKGRQLIPHTSWLSKKFNNAKILLAEDNEINRQVAGELLDSLGIKVTMAVNGKEAVQKSASHEYDCILMDINMPEMDGYEATKTIRGKENKSLPIIAMTANAMHGDREKCLASGMNDYISKPINPDEIVSTLEKWIGQFMENPGHVPVEHELGEFLTLDGINIEEGLQRIGGNTKAYKTLLINFTKNQANTLDNIKSALEKEDLEDAGFIIHTLKGVSGNIGATLLCNATKDLEATLKENQSTDLIYRKLENVKRAMEEVFNSISVFDTKEDDTPQYDGHKEIKDKDREKLTTVLYELSRLIKDRDTDAEEYLEETKGFLKQFYSVEEDYYKLENQLSIYDYKSAISTLDNIIKVINIPLKYEKSKDNAHKEINDEDKEKLVSVLSELSELIKDRDTDAEEYLEETKEFLKQFYSVEEDYYKLENQLSTYDYKNATDTLDNIIKVINIPLKGEANE